MPFNVGPVELIIVLVIALLVIGPRRLPEMGNAVGKTIREFRKASTDISEATTLESEAKPAAPPPAAPSPSPDATAPQAASAESPAAPAAPAASAEAKSDDD
jgi:sec-independent protein translocase protein TatA